VIWQASRPSLRGDGTRRWREDASAGNDDDEDASMLVYDADDAILLLMVGEAVWQ
jgi:hypothetical protein